MDYDVSKNIVEISKSSVSNIEVPFDLFSLSREQINSHSKICNVCGEDFQEFKYMRNHQTVMHYNIIRRYNKLYGNIFEKYLDKF
ncbi:hypothetical protein BpHYR1_017775 [Brachionus plicatilis]|uniref:C2H2-type domain-containing protein n=1 Tax=Brachionus plicatilis TaxID=10195 RepID=A0A3M7PF72_BRAPC|nr:hypothetical protein BpHYR1_017775 [Brachionus plicatilis]